MNPLPLPLRVAAGLVATAVEQARELPRLVVEFPVTAISHTLQASMRLQQKVTALAIKGDRALGTMRTPEEVPAWATFDDEEPAPAPLVTPSELSSPNGAVTSTVTELRPQNRRPAAPRRAARRNAPEPADTPPPVDPAAPLTAEPPAEPAAADTGADDAGPTELPGYREMTIPQLRARLRKLSADDLRALLAWETAHENRPPFVTMLTNRITTVTES